MKLAYKKGWNSLMPLRVGKKSFRFCLFSKVRSTEKASGNAPVYLNVYDLTPLNGYVYWAGLGIFHSGVEVHGVEYAFGAHDYATSGVFEVEPRQCPGFRFRKSIFIGTTSLNPIQVREFMGHHSVNYNGNTYHLIAKNCNHFCKDVCYKLTGNSIPKWVNRLARIGSFCNRLLPETIKISAIRHEPAYEEKRRLKGSFDCLSFMSVRHGPLFSSSPLFSLPLKGCLPPLESRKSGLIPLKGRWKKFLPSS
ncbi:hypothetical protein HPP92_020957 [Vanilla planifolia]|uniref:PPPDE domain-containing protein n=1 Tax=Vanilla planifolia TaxID=51239 RepID=A0A835Q1M9_VANPL|nr:hypothetical protein HPP92_020957 [Vanilla planifolia]